MKNLSPSLLALAAACALPVAAYSLDVKDDDVKLGLYVYLQPRAEMANASSKQNAAGDSTAYDVTSGKSGAKSDQADFYLRRARFGFKGSYQSDYKFAMVLTTDKVDYNGSASSRNPEIYNAWIGYENKGEGITHYFQAGLQNAFFNGAGNVVSSSASLLPTVRATENGYWISNRGVGVEYVMTTPWFTWGSDIMNAVNTGATVKGLTGNGDGPNNVDQGQNNGGPGRGEGLCYTTRIQISPAGDWNIAKMVDSFAGKAGKGILVSFEAGENQRDNVGATAAGVNNPAAMTSTAAAMEVLLHLDGLSALTEFRTVNHKLTGKTAAGVPTNDHVTGNIWLVQAGYALPLGDKFIEPAARFTRINKNNGKDAETASGVGDPEYGAGPDYGNSGYQTELGVNYYIRGHNNKIGLMYQHWRAESGTARANLGIAQWQLMF